MKNFLTSAFVLFVLVLTLFFFAFMVTIDTVQKNIMTSPEDPEIEKMVRNLSRPQVQVPISISGTTDSPLVPDLPEKTATKTSPPPWVELGISKEAWDNRRTIPKPLWLHSNESEEMDKALLHNPLELFSPEERTQALKYFSISGENETEFAEKVQKEVAVRWLSNQYKIPDNIVEHGWKELTRNVFGREMTGPEVYLALREMRQEELKRGKTQPYIITVVVVVIAGCFFGFVGVLLRYSDIIGSFFEKNVQKVTPFFKKCFSKENYYKTCMLVFGFIITISILCMALKICF